MKEITRRNFLKTAVTCLAGSLAFAEIASAKRISKEVIKRVLEPKLDSLTKKIIQIESQWTYWAVSTKKAIGLMQITPIALKEWNEHGPGKIYKKHDLFKPFINVTIGKWYLHERIGEYYLPHYKLPVTDENKAASYHAGPPLIGKIGDAIKNFHKLPEKTKDYIFELWRLS